MPVVALRLLLWERSLRNLRWEVAGRWMSWAKEKIECRCPSSSQEICGRQLPVCRFFLSFPDLHKKDLSLCQTVLGWADFPSFRIVAVSVTDPPYCAIPSKSLQTEFQIVRKEIKMTFRFFLQHSNTLVKARHKSLPLHRRPNKIISKAL